MDQVELELAIDKSDSVLDKVEGWPLLTTVSRAAQERQVQTAADRNLVLSSLTAQFGSSCDFEVCKHNNEDQIRS